MQKIIYFNNKPLFLSNTLTGGLEEYAHRKDTILIDELNIHTVKTMIHEMEQPEIHAGLFLWNDVDTVLEAFKRKLTPIQAAGGFIYAGDSSILFIFRKGKWDLPKGKLDEGEDLEACAIREIQEETGLRSLKLEAPLAVTYHTYRQQGEHVIKESHWYLVKGEKSEPLSPQLDEDIDQCVWVRPQDVARLMDNTHASIADVVRTGLGKINGERVN